MEDKTITLTEAELQAKINDAVNEATDALISKHNGEMANMRKENKALKDANLSSEERAKQDLEEQRLATEKELGELRAFKKNSIISEKLAKENLPSYLKNDSRLINASESELDKAIKLVKSDYESSLPKGNTHSSVVVNATSGGKQADTKSEAYEKMGEVLNSIIGK